MVEYSPGFSLIGVYVASEKILKNILNRINKEESTKPISVVLENSKIIYCCTVNVHLYLNE